MDYTKSRWITLICTIPISICIGSFYAWSVFAIPLSEELGISVTRVTVAFTISSGFSGIMNIVGGALYDRYGSRFVLSVGGIFFAIGYFLTGLSSSLAWLLIVYGIAVGFGLGTSYCTFVTNIANAFPDKRGFATGIILGGYGSGAFIFAPLGNFLIENYGVLNAFKILGVIIFLIIIVLVQFVKTPPRGFKPSSWHPEKNNNVIVQTKIDKDWKHMLRDPLYYMILGMLVIATTSGLMIMGHGSAIAQSIAGASPALAAWMVGLVSIANACGRFLVPTISDKIGRSNALIFIYILASIAMAVLTLLKPGQLILLTIIMLIIGFCYGGNMGVFPAMTTDSFGTKYSGTNFGFVFTGTLFGSIIGPTLASLVKSQTGSYTIAFLVASMLCVVGAVLAYLAGRKVKKINNSN